MYLMTMETLSLSIEIFSVFKSYGMPSSVRCDGDPQKAVLSRLNISIRFSPLNPLQFVLLRSDVVLQRRDEVFFSVQEICHLAWVATNQKNMPGLHNASLIPSFHDLKGLQGSVLHGVCATYGGEEIIVGWEWLQAAQQQQTPTWQLHPERERDKSFWWICLNVLVRLMS